MKTKKLKFSRFEKSGYSSKRLNKKSFGVPGIGMVGVFSGNEDYHSRELTRAAELAQKEAKRVHTELDKGNCQAALESLVVTEGAAAVALSHSRSVKNADFRVKAASKQAESAETAFFKVCTVEAKKRH
jgi:hypothetical protein